MPRTQTDNNLIVFFIVFSTFSKAKGKAVEHSQRRRDLKLVLNRKHHDHERPPQPSE
ncbi:protein of unknown function [Pseudomonas mediterranea]